jgi:hypothetical protein
MPPTPTRKEYGQDCRNFLNQKGHADTKPVTRVEFRNN